jgi:signal transduction histidine kinase
LGRGARTSRVALDTESRRGLDLIRTNARQMGSLIDDLLSFSRREPSDLERATSSRATTSVSTATS